MIPVLSSHLILIIRELFTELIFLSLSLSTQNSLRGVIGKCNLNILYNIFILKFDSSVNFMPLAYF